MWYARKGGRCAPDFGISHKAIIEPYAQSVSSNVSQVALLAKGIHIRGSPSMDGVAFLDFRVSPAIVDTNVDTPDKIVGKSQFCIEHRDHRELRKRIDELKDRAPHIRQTLFLTWTMIAKDREVCVSLGKGRSC